MYWLADGPGKHYLLCNVECYTFVVSENLKGAVYNSKGKHLNEYICNNYFSARAINLIYLHKCHLFVTLLCTDFPHIII